MALAIHGEDKPDASYAYFDDHEFQPALCSTSKMNRFKHNEFNNLASRLKIHVMKIKTETDVQNEQDIYHIINTIFSYTFECITRFNFLFYYERYGIMYDNEIWTEIKLFTPMNCINCDLDDPFFMKFEKCVPLNLQQTLYDIPSFTPGLINVVTSFLGISNTCNSCSRAKIEEHFKDIQYCDICFKIKCKHCHPIHWLENIDSDCEAPYNKLKYSHCDCWEEEQEEKERQWDEEQWKEEQKGQEKVCSYVDECYRDDDYYEDMNNQDDELDECYDYGDYGEFVLFEYSEKNL
eukprot:197056_1